MVDNDDFLMYHHYLVPVIVCMYCGHRRSVAKVFGTSAQIHVAPMEDLRCSVCSRKGAKITFGPSLSPDRVDNGSAYSWDRCTPDDWPQDYFAPDNGD